MDVINSVVLHRVLTVRQAGSHLSRRLSSLEHGRESGRFTAVPAQHLVWRGLEVVIQSRPHEADAMGEGVGRRHGRSLGEPTVVAG